MEIIRYQDPKKFQQKIWSYLLGREAENNLIFGILADIIVGKYQEHKIYLARAQDGGDTQAVILCTAPWPALVSYENPPPRKEIIEAILLDLQDFLQDDFCGISGNREFISPLVSAWEKGSGKPAVLKMSTKIYKLEQVQPPKAIPGKMRLPEEKERKLLEDWVADFYRGIEGNEPELDFVHKQVEAYFSADPLLRGLRIWDIEGQPVSMAGYAGPTPNGIRIGAVYTPPEQRRQGYASAVTAGLSQHLLDQGLRFCFLFTDLLNPTSNHIYQQIGYRPVCEAVRYLFV